MTKKYSILGIIPARGGSKGLPGKNIIDLGGKPLLAWTIEESLASSMLDRVVLTTDDEEIAAVGRQYGCEVPFMRPAELASDTAHTPDVMEHAVTYLEDNEVAEFDIVVLLQPTAPFRKAWQLDEAINQFLAADYVSLISLKEQDYPPYWMFKLDGDRIQTAFPFKQGVNVFNLERQELPQIYRPNGAIYVTWRNQLRERGQLVDPNDCGYYIMDLDTSVDIDTRMDLMIAESILQRS